VSTLDGVAPSPGVELAVDRLQVRLDRVDSTTVEKTVTVTSAREQAPTTDTTP
jgi:hypothetical protein